MGVQLMGLLATSQRLDSFADATCNVALQWHLSENLTHKPNTFDFLSEFTHDHANFMLCKDWYVFWPRFSPWKVFQEQLEALSCRLCYRHPNRCLRSQILMQQACVPSQYFPAGHSPLVGINVTQHWRQPRSIKYMACAQMECLVLCAITHIGSAIILWLYCWNILWKTQHQRSSPSLFFTAIREVSLE